MPTNEAGRLARRLGRVKENAGMSHTDLRTSVDE
jgi:hypothetical protein